ncbi:MAG: MarR family transcriptional regulator [Chloroflexi bacterium]|nr:MarR family transcriptional regulator [Chloroflexota bacterium]
MAKTHLQLQVDQVGEILRGFIRLKPLLNEPLTPRSLQATRRLKALHAQVGIGHFEVSGLFFRLGVVLYEHAQPMTMSELSKELNVPLSTATRMVDWLVAHHFAERSPDPQDRRIVRVGMTPLGRETYQEMNNLFAHRLEQVLSQLTPKERRQFIALLGKIAQSLKKIRCGDL